ncbi:TolC family protein [bacterium]|nr:TolC family protein [bacterium]
MKKLILLLIFVGLIFGAFGITLNEYIDTALQNSNKYKSARLQFDIKKIEYNISKSQFFPKISLALRMPDYSWNNNYMNYPGLPQRISLISERKNLGGVMSLSQNLPFSAKLTLTHSTNKYSTDYNIYENVNEYDNFTSLTFTLPILEYDPQKREYSRKKAELEIAKNNFERIKRQVRKEAMSYYIQAQLYLKQLEIAKQDLAISEMLRDTTQEKYKSGLSSDLDIMSGKIQINQKTINLQNIENKYAELIDTMKNYANLNEELKISNDRVKLYEEELPAMNKLLGYIMNSDPDIRNYYIQRDDLNYQMKYDKFRKYFSASANFGYSLDGRGDSLSESFANYEKSGWHGYFLVNIPIFDMSYQKNQYEKNRKNLKSIKLSILDLKKNISQSIKNLYHENENYLKTLKLLKLQVEQSEKLLNLSQLRYKNGLDSLETVEKNQLQYLNSKFNYENTIYQLNNNYLDILYYKE